MGWTDTIINKVVDKLFPELVDYVPKFAPVRSNYSETNPERMARTELVREMEMLGLTNLSSRRIDDYQAARELLAGGTFQDFCVKLVNDYHAGDTKLTRLMLRAALRVIFSSNSALLHIATTGRAGAGKNDLIENVTALLPDGIVVPYASITSKNLFYELEEEIPGEKKKVVNPYHFAGKIISITEIADSKGFSGLKAFAELNERTAATHKATRTLALQVKGTRAMWIASVTGVQSNQADIDQVNRRFLNKVIEPDSDQKTRAKILAVTDSLVNQRNITDDSRLKIAKAGFDLLFASRPKFEQTPNDVAQMTEDLLTMLNKKGQSPSAMKQLYALAECAAVEKQFQRGYVRIEKQDIIEAWWLSGFSTEEECLLNGEWCKAQMVEKVVEEEQPYDNTLPFDVTDYTPEYIGEPEFPEEEYVTRMAEHSTNEWGRWRYENRR